MTVRPSWKRIASLNWPSFSYKSTTWRSRLRALGFLAFSKRLHSANSSVKLEPLETSTRHHDQEFFQFFSTLIDWIWRSGHYIAQIHPCSFVTIVFLNGFLAEPSPVRNWLFLPLQQFFPRRFDAGSLVKSRPVSAHLKPPLIIASYTSSSETSSWLLVLEFSCRAPLLAQLQMMERQLGSSSFLKYSPICFPHFLQLPFQFSIFQEAWVSCLISCEKLLQTCFSVWAGSKATGDSLLVPPH